ncbi:MAG TPA: hypothetical protein VGN97_15595 [Mesorhizobium sp.]|jgi:hypothetical protein|nr:hypothetical protein [Mesorhizobium sp.]
MSDAITRTRKRGRPSTGAHSIHLRIEPGLLAALDKMAAEVPTTTRPQAVRMILTDWLTGHGYLAHKAAPPEMSN